MSTAAIPLASVGRLPHPDDNVAVAVRRLEAGLVLTHGGESFALTLPVLEGHRFAVRALSAGESLLSWGRPFGKARRDILPGEYVCNQGMLEALAQRGLDFSLPAEPNFEEDLHPGHFDRGTWTPAEPVPPPEGPRVFQGYPRSGGRAAGVRNYLVLLGANARIAPFVRALADRLRADPAGLPGFDGVAAIAHTEGDLAHAHNLDFVRRTLGGYAVHPNAGAVLCLDAGPSEPIHNRSLLAWMGAQGYPLDHVPHASFSLEADWDRGLAAAARAARALLAAGAATRVACPLGELKLALQCGGSDAFSGISANPLLGWASREILRHGGAANIAETDELIGAEAYMIARTRTPEVAERFLALVDRFREYAGWHGASAEGNPTGGNKFRGLYNIHLKSIGAAMKKAPDVRLDHAIEHAERMLEPGFYFMDSPGNDLESIAGQVAGGCQIIYFSTGNGSITNHPLAPTIKVVTTTPRFELLRRDMDVNAGAYLDGTPMEELGRALVELTVEVASGRRTVGEAAGHTQVQLWRNWRRSAPGPLEPASPVRLGGTPVPVRLEGAPRVALSFPVRDHGRGPAAESLGLVMPTSLCAGAIATRAADRLSALLAGRGGLTRWLSLPHTEGCCVSQNAERLYPRTAVAAVTHPAVATCLLLEHGCEVTHNDFMRAELARAGVAVEALGFASIQRDGGIDAVLDRIEAWFRARLTAASAPIVRAGGLADLRLALTLSGPMPEETALDLARVVQAVVAGGGSVVVDEHAGLLRSPAFRQILEPADIRPTLAYAQRSDFPGFHIMASPTRQWNEVLTGLAGTGVQAILAHQGVRPLSGTPLVPVVQFTAHPESGARYGADFDFVLPEDGADGPARILGEVARVLREGVVACRRRGQEDFQVTRGELAVTL
jgi:altronate dehydratase